MIEKITGHTTITNNTVARIFCVCKHIKILMISGGLLVTSLCVTPAQALEERPVLGGEKPGIVIPLGSPAEATLEAPAALPCDKSLHALTELQLFDQTKEGVVSIETRVSHGAYTARGVRLGTGFLVDKENGFILTNRHVAASASVGIHFVTFFNGRQLTAHKIYEDPYHDFAILQVKASELPTSSIALTFAKDKPKTGDGVVIVGKNEGQDFSFHTGRISSTFESVGYLPGQSMRISLNTRGGSSGSPVFNLEGQVIALNHAGSDTSAFALHTGYLTRVLDVFKKNPQQLKRWDICVDLQYEPIDKLVRHLNFSSEMANQYRIDYPDAAGKVLVCQWLHAGSPAHGKLEAGDVLWRVDGTRIGPNLETFQLLMDKKNGEPITVDVVRNGKSVTVSIQPSMILGHQVTRFVEFGGGIFFGADDFTNSQTGCGIGTVMVNAIDEGGALFQTFTAANLGSGFNIRIASLNNQKIDTLDDLIRHIPGAIKKEHFSIGYRNYGVSPGYNGSAITTRAGRQSIVTFANHQSPPRVFTFDRNASKWIVETIALKE